MELKASYSSAGVFPGKLLKMADTCVDYDGTIRPVHVQLCPTNICNLNCPFCSCSEREKGQELALPDIEKAIDTFIGLGMKAVTMTGGGEPCCHPDITKIIGYLYSMNVEIGLVSNGIPLSEVKDALHKVTWCRVSVSDFRAVDKLLASMADIVPATGIDWAFSYVATSKFSIDKFSKVVEFANLHDFTHVRIVSDIMDLSGPPPMALVKSSLAASGIDDRIVIYQDRQEFTRGARDCRSGLLKPVLAPDGYLYVCCGCQYAIDGETGVFPDRLRMCHMSEIADYWKAQEPFNGLICDRCYYGNYNDSLGKMVQDYDHEVFV